MKIAVALLVALVFTAPPSLAEDAKPIKIYEDIDLITMRIPELQKAYLELAKAHRKLQAEHAEVKKHLSATATAKSSGVSPDAKTGGKVTVRVTVMNVVIADVSAEKSELKTLKRKQSVDSPAQMEAREAARVLKNLRARGPYDEKKNRDGWRSNDIAAANKRVAAAKRETGRITKAIRDVERKIKMAQSERLLEVVSDDGVAFVVRARGAWASKAAGVKKGQTYDILVDDTPAPGKTVDFRSAAMVAMPAVAQ